MLCCPNCFDDSFLSLHVPQISESLGTCDFCSRTNVPLIRPSQLRDEFEAVVSIYATSDENCSEPLLSWLRTDWGMFNLLSSATANMLLTLILDDADIAERRLLPIELPNASATIHWATFKEEIMWRNRFFFRQQLDLERLKGLFNAYLEVDTSELNERLFRARVLIDDEILSLKDMGKPPAKLTKNGRANPLGIPYLYTASSPDTAIAELRPHPGDRVVVALFEIDTSLRLLNLKHPRKTISPFLIDESELSSFRQELAFLCKLEEELSKPVLPRVADLEYLPTQYLCEFIKMCGFDGVIFQSSISDGFNVALFSDEKVHPSSINLYEVTKLEYQQILVN